MRRISFRGKSRETGEWLYGCLLNTFSKNEDICLIVDPDDTELDMQLGEASCYRVDPHTVGMGTGIWTGEGVEIYEHDIVTGSNLPDEGGEVYWDEETGQWVVGFDNEDGEYDEYALCQAGANRAILGNKHDNPELL